jgi:tRNA A-37 threonylcarbamoyl transferase component Bud32
MSQSPQQQPLTDVERDRRAMEIFVQACGLAAAERAKLLAELCADDSTVRTRVEAMLRADSGDDGHTPVGSDADVDGFVARQIDSLTHCEDDGDAGMSTAAHAVDGEYTLLRVIGEGGMGTVYEAEQHHPRRRVAIKAIRPGRITPQMSRRFEYEAQVLARLEHPGIARLYESNAQHDAVGHVRAYLAMELVDGVPIDTYCAANGLSHVERLRLFMRVCDAVSYAHRMGVIHRDLKPANILVTPEGQPKILDFGVARTVEGTRGGAADVTMLTEHGQIVGTLAYMSPEQVEGRADVDTRTDVYSLGVILYRLLAGVLPIDCSGDSIIEATRRILTETPARIGQHDRRLRGDLEVVVCHALEKEPARRYASVDQLRDELDRHLSGRPIEARADSAVYVFRKAIWRHRGPVGVALLLVGLLVAFGVVASIQAERSRRLAEVAVDSEGRATQRADELRRLLYFSHIGFAQSAMANNDMERAYTLLEGCDGTLREWEWFHLHWLRDLSRATTQLPLGRPRYASFSTDHSRVALASLDREIVLLDPSAGYRELLREQVPEGTARAALSLDGRWLAFGG